MSLYIAGPDRESNRTCKPRERKPVTFVPCPACGSPAWSDTKYVRRGIRYCSSACVRVGGGK